MKSPLVGAIPKTEGLLMALSDLPGFFSEELMMQHTVDPIWQINYDYHAGRISSFVAQERLRRALEHIEEEFGLYYAPTWAQVRDGKFDDFDGMYHSIEWALYVDSAFDRKILRELADYETDVDPIELADAAAHATDLLILDIQASDFVYVVKSDTVVRGQASDQSICELYYPAMEVAIIDNSLTRRSVACYGLPENIAAEARAYEAEFRGSQR